MAGAAVKSLGSWTPVLKQLGAFALIAATLYLYLRNPAERTYWPYMLTAYALAVFVYFREPAEKRKGIFRYLFPPGMWTHRSAINDCLLALLNIVFIAVVFRHTVLNPGMIVFFSKKAAMALTAMQQQPPPGMAAVIVYTIASLLMSDLFYYISHRLSHRVQWLWEFHKVHHSAEVMTPLTLYRMHPFDFWQNSFFRAIGLGITSFIFLYFYPGTWSAMVVGGVNAGIFAANVLGANLRHSHIWLSFGPAIEHVVLSPAQHQIHHSANPKHSNKNYASLLSLWDWMFGSLYVPKGREEVSFGLGTEKLQRPYQTLWGLCWQPFKKIFNS